MNVIRTLAWVALALGSMRAGAQGSIAGTVFDSLSTGAPLANATVVLVERSRYATTDTRGRFQIDSVPDGRYTLGFMHAVLDSLDLTAPVVLVDVNGGRRTTVALFTPGPAAAYGRICPGAYEAETGVIIGRVRDADDKAPLADATVTTDWTEYTVTAGRVAGHRVGAVARANREGTYVLCGVPTNVPLEVRTELAGISGGPVPLLMNARLIGRIDFAVSRRDSAARTVALGDSVTMTAGPSGTASLRGTLLGSDGRPIRDAVVRVLGTQRSGRTDAAGVFRVDHIPAGTRTIEVRSIGLSPMSVSMDFATNAARDTTLSVNRTAQALNPVTVNERGTSMSLMENEGFETRRKYGLGAYMTAQEIARHGYSEIISVLQSMRGVQVEYVSGGGGIRDAIPSLLGISDFNQMRCAPNFFLDGAPLSSGPGGFAQLSTMVRPEAIKGIEVYSNPGTIPAQYDLTSSTGCGSIIIWTR